MTTIDAPTVSQLIALKVNQWALKRARRTERTNRQMSVAPEERAPFAWLYAMVRLILHIAGFAALTYAGFEWNTAAGFVVAGISCFALSTLLTHRSDNDG